MKESQERNNVCSQNVFNEIFQRLSKDIYNFLYYKFGPENNPEDLVQDAFSKLWQNCEKVPPEKARSYLFTIANNSMLNELSKKKTALTYRNTNQSKEATKETPEYLYQENEFNERLQKALNELSDDQRLTLMLNRVEGKRHKEIAEMLGISRKTVEKRIYTALAILEKKIGKI